MKYINDNNDNNYNNTILNYNFLQNRYNSLLKN